MLNKFMLWFWEFWDQVWDVPPEPIMADVDMRPDFAYAEQQGLGKAVEGDWIPDLQTQRVWAVLVKVADRYMAYFGDKTLVVDAGWLEVDGKVVAMPFPCVEDTLSAEEVHIGMGQHWDDGWRVIYLRAEGCKTVALYLVEGEVVAYLPSPPTGRR